MTQIRQIYTDKNPLIVLAEHSVKNKICKRIRLLIIPAIIILLLQGEIMAQDTNFWFSVPHLSEAISGGQLNLPAFLAISNGTNQIANVTITRYNGGTPIINNISIAAGQLYKMDFLTDPEMKTIENSRGTAGNVTHFGTHITSNVKVYAYYMANSPASRDIFTLKGESALGTEFYVPMQSDNYDQTQAASYAGACDQIDIVATEDGTVVTVKPTAAIRIGASSSSPAGTIITRTLNKGQTLKIMEHVVNCLPSLAGTHITATNPIAVTVTEDLTDGGDVAGDQIVPVTSLGKRYVIAKGYMTTAVRERIYMFATVNGTTISINNGSTTITSPTLNAGDAYMYNITANVVYVEASEPIYCFQRTGYTEPGAALLPSMYSISQNQVTYFQVAAQYEKAFVLFRTGTAAGFTISYNNATYPLNVGSPIAVPSVPEWQCARFDLPSAANDFVVKISNPQSMFSFGYIAANLSGNTMTSYGYLSQFGSLTLPDTTYICDNSTVTLDAGYAASYNWTLPDNSHQNTATIIASDTGLYSVVVNQDPFLVTASTRVLNRFEGSSLISSHTGNICAGTHTYTVSHGLYSPEHVSYNWFVDNVQVGTGSSYTTTWSESDEICIRVEITDTILNCSKIHQMIFAVVHPDTTTIEDVICVGQIYNKYGFKLPPHENIGVYEYMHHTQTLHGCDSITILQLTVYDVFEAEIFKEEADFCMTSQITLLAVSNSENSIAWSTGDTTRSITVTQAGNYLLTVTDKNGCQVTDRVTIPHCDVVLVLPNAITASRAEGVNDCFALANPQSVTELKIYIYNRWGNLVFYSNDPYFSWDGKDKNGEIEANTVYVYLLQATTVDKKKHYLKGIITVL